MENEGIFVDANIFIDIARKRAGWKRSAAALTAIKKRNGFVSSLSVAIVYFIKVRSLSPPSARRETREAIEGLKIASVTSDMVTEAFNNENMEDFEDAIQFYCARSVAKVLVTRNKHHYQSVEREIELLTPEEFLKKYGT